MTTSLSAFFGKDKNKAYFFSGDRYIRYDKLADKADDGYPAQIRAIGPLPLTRSTPSSTGAMEKRTLQRESLRSLRPRRTARTTAIQLQSTGGA